MKCDDFVKMWLDYIYIYIFFSIVPRENCQIISFVASRVLQVFKELSERTVDDFIKMMAR